MESLPVIIFIVFFGLALYSYGKAALQSERLENSQK